MSIWWAASLNCADSRKSSANLLLNRQARMKGCQVLVSLLDRKAKLLGMDAPVKVEAPPTGDVS
jgi:hypothetical protein